MRCAAQRTRPQRTARLGIAADEWHPIGDGGIKRALGTLRAVLGSFVPDVVHAHGFSAIALALGAFAEHADWADDRLLSRPAARRGAAGQVRDRALARIRAAGRATGLRDARRSRARSSGRCTLEPERIVVIPHGIAPSFAARVRAAGPPPRPAARVVRQRCAASVPGASRSMRSRSCERRSPMRGSRSRGTGPREIDRRRRTRATSASRRSSIFAARSPIARCSPGSICCSSRVPIDAQPQVLLEALSWGMPVVAGNGGALADALHACEAGLLVADDAAGFARGIARDVAAHRCSLGTRREPRGARAGARMRGGASLDADPGTRRLDPGRRALSRAGSRLRGACGSLGRSCRLRRPACRR